jgi:hypothetical protein
VLIDFLRQRLGDESQITGPRSDAVGDYDGLWNSEVRVVG